MITFSYSSIEVLFAAFFWPFVRVLALFSVAPVLGNKSIPLRVRVGLAAAIAFVVAPGLPAPEDAGLSSALAISILAQQILVGVALGFAMRIAFAAIELAGDLIGLQMGLSFAGFVDPQHAASQTPLIGSFIGTLAAMMFLALDGHLALIAALVDTFRSVPVRADLVGVIRWERLAALGKGLFENGLHMALPVIASMLVINLALGVVARAAPSLNIFSVGFPLTLLTGLGLLALFLPHIGVPMRAAIEAALTAFP